MLPSLKLQVINLGHTAPNSNIAAAASGVMFEMAITNAGTTNNPVLVQTLKHMPLVDTFWGTIKFSPASTMNIARNTTLIQYSGLIANNIDDGSGLVYPAPWPWTNEVGMVEH